MAKSTIIAELTADEAKLIQGYQRAMKENARFKEELRDLSRTGRQSLDWFGGFEKAAAKAFSPAGLASFATGLAGAAGGLSVASALQRVVGLAGEARTEFQTMADELKGTYEVSKSLWTLSANAEDYAQLSASQRLAMAKEGIDRAKAGQLLFNLKSLGKEEALPVITKAARFMDPETAAKYYTTAASDLAYGEKAGTPQQVLSGLLSGAEFSKMNPDQTADWVLRVAPALAAFDTSQAEMLAVGASISESAVDASALATAMKAGYKDLAKWKAEAIEASKIMEPAPEAPEKPKYEPPAKPDRIYTSPVAAQNADLAYQERLAAYDQRHAEDMAEYRIKETEYRQALGEWEQTNAARKQIADAASQAKGMVEVFQTMKSADPAGYQQNRLRSVEFNAFAAAFEKGLPKAIELEPKIQAEIDAARLFETKADARPRQLNEQQQLLVAEEQLRLSGEARAEEETRLRTVVAQNKMLANFTGVSPTATKAWEQLLDKGATLAGTQAATREATDALVDTLYARRPDIFQEHLAPMVPVKSRPLPTAPGGRSVYIDDPQLPAEITPQLTAGITAAMDALTEGNVEARRQADIAEARAMYPTGPAAAMMVPAMPSQPTTEPQPAMMVPAMPSQPTTEPAAAMMVPAVPSQPTTEPAAAMMVPAVPAQPPTSPAAAMMAPSAADRQAASYAPASSPDRPAGGGTIPTVIVTPTPAPDSPAVIAGLQNVVAELRHLRDDMAIPRTYFGSQIQQPLAPPETK